MGDAFVNCGSQRARQRLGRLLGTLPECHRSWDHPATGGYDAIPEERLSEARTIPGITRMKYPEELMPCRS
jgi:hypothetical protein